MFLTGWIADYPDPQNFLDQLFRTGSGENEGEYSNASVDALLAEARQERDPSKRVQLYQQAERAILEDGAAIPLFHSTRYVLVKPYVKNFLVGPFGVTLLQKVEVASH
jgi:oligopeptide transport system substrate-binding protein